jgi:hypothetical protein
MEFGRKAGQLLVPRRRFGQRSAKALKEQTAHG